MTRVYCSTGTFIGRVNGRDYRLIPSQAALLGHKRFELMLFDGWYPVMDDLLAFFAGYDLSFPVVHAEKSIGDALGGSQEDQALRRFAVNCRAARELGAFLVLHLWNGHATAQTVSRLCDETLPSLLAIAAEYGVELTVENTPMAAYSPLAAMRTIHEAHPGQRFTIDLRHTAFQAEEQALRGAQWLWPCVAHIHVSDFGGTPGDFSTLRAVPMPGEGKIDFDGWFAFLRAAGYDGGYTLESNSMCEHGLRDPGAVMDALRFIREHAEHGSPAHGEHTFGMSIKDRP